MKIRWGNRRFTFMIIPDANRSVIRLKFSERLFYIIPAVLFMLISITLSFYIIYLKNVATMDNLTIQLENQSKNFEHTVADKNQTIDQLQYELIELSQQAEQIQFKIEEVKRLEQEMKSIGGITSRNKTDASETDIMVTAGMGGQSIPVSVEDFSNLAQMTKSNYNLISGEMGELIESLSETKEQVLEVQRLLRITPNIWPTDTRKISSHFGIRRDPFNSVAGFHGGMDIGGDNNDPVYATADGVVVSTGYHPVKGNFIEMDHTRGLITKYLHLNKTNVKKGQSIEKGQEIGLMGSTGRSTGPHLHYEVLKNGENVNPMSYLK